MTLLPLFFILWSSNNRDFIGVTPGFQLFRPHAGIILPPSAPQYRIFTGHSNLHHKLSILRKSQGHQQLPGGSRYSPVILRLVSGNSKLPRGNSGGPQSPRSFVQRLIRTIRSGPRQWLARWKSLPPRAKRFLLARWMLTVLLVGMTTKRVVTSRTSLPPPIEIPYSKFLDLVDQQSNAPTYTAPPPTTATTTTGIPPSPSPAVAIDGTKAKIEGVRIGTDRIIYRIYPANPTTTSADLLHHEISKSSAMVPLTSSNTNAARRPSWMRPSQSKSTRRKALPYINAYTRPVSGSPELLHSLRRHSIPFAAAPAPKTSTVVVAFRTVLVGFYMAILWRLYQTISNAGGGGTGKKDVPGKLASVDPAVPMADFDDIQGIDGVKTEVMELVDTLRNPDKYAILGARAPTGLLLEGPPGTGKHRRRGGWIIYTEDTSRYTGIVREQYLWIPSLSMNSSQ